MGVQLDWGCVSKPFAPTDLFRSTLFIHIIIAVVANVANELPCRQAKCSQMK